MPESPPDEDLPVHCSPPARAPGRTVARAFVASLKLTDFRNYAGLALALDPRSVVLTGQNGAGKT
ncbi:MAG: hypothetical protein J0H63_11155, partial [Rhizobiales bacterium]|nr:hypothetical protein [Hyphomicrobiales bacterium]